MGSPLQQQNQSPLLPLRFKKNLFNYAVLWTLLRHSHILLVGCNNENQLKVTLQFLLAKGTFN